MLIFLRLGCYAFGGPAVHISLFQQQLVEKRRWLSQAALADLLTLCQILPGPASSQLGMALGYQQAKLKGAIAAWLGFTLPSALLMTLLALLLPTMLTKGGINGIEQLQQSGVWRGLMLGVAVVVLQAIWQMQRTLCTDWPKRLLWLTASGWFCWQSGITAQLDCLVVAALFGLALARFRPQLMTATVSSNTTNPISSALSPTAKSMWPQWLAYLALFALLFMLVPLQLYWWPDDSLALFNQYYRSGALVFGGGHVVLPVLQQELVISGQMLASDLYTGYAAAQLMPGPLFSFASFAAALDPNSGGWSGALLGTVAIFLPGALLLLAMLPLWAQLRQNHQLQQAFGAMNAAIVGLLTAAFIDPIASKALTSAMAIGIFALAFYLAQRYKLAVYWLLPGCAITGALFGL